MMMIFVSGMLLSFFPGDNDFAYSSTRCYAYQIELELGQALLIKQHSRGGFGCARPTFSANMIDSSVPAAVLNTTLGPLLLGVVISTV